MRIKIKEKSLVAKIAARKLKSDHVAMVLGGTIYLSGATKADLLNNKRWLRHELKHIEQQLRYGFLWFLLLYTWYSIRHGYYNNRFEQEARAAEHTAGYLEQFI
ncbi:MAG: hypothetical protein BGO31_16570 [Bacteroidetes bacterium 43-16]|nr:MAG: hypothetical protein BGO31_16570 [Bacteroidetes bacterium 43-16]